MATAKEFVLQHYPNAQNALMGVMYGVFESCTSTKMIASGVTKAEAWKNAKAKILENESRCK